MKIDKNCSYLVSSIAVVSMLAFPFAVLAQSISSGDSSIPRLENGKPDIQGTWDFRTITPMQRPVALGEKAYLTEEEARIFEAEENVRRDRDNFTDTSTTGDYNQFWYDRGTELVGDRRTSLITSPSNGRIPEVTETTRTRQIQRSAARELTLGVEARPLAERCIMGFNSGPPMTPSAYNNNVQLVQTENHLLIHNEMVHNARIVRMNATEHREFPRKWEGDSIGYWEGDTLVVETDHFLRDTSFGNSSENMFLIERFTLINENTLDYEFTIEDSTTWTQPWTANFPMRRAELPIYEYACHEGNYSLAGVLGGWRQLEFNAEQEAD
jgi:hypothetical protein